MSDGLKIGVSPGVFGARIGETIPERAICEGAVRPLRGVFIGATKKTGSSGVAERRVAIA